MAVGRISGPLLKANLLRQGVDLAFETDLVYLQVTDPSSTNHKVGIKTTSPTHTLTVDGTTKTTNLLVDTLAEIADISISGTTVSTAQNVLSLIPSGASPVVYQAKLRVDDIELENNVIRTHTTNTDLELRPNGTGTVEVFADTNVYGNIHATGNISADGNITLGDANTDNIIFAADVASNIIPDLDDTYTLGESGKRWADVWTNNLFSDFIDTGDIVVDNINLNLRQGNIIYVAVNGSDSYSGTHQNDPYLTLRYALSQATVGDTVYVYPGDYEEIFPLTVPQGVAIVGANLRSVIIRPTAATRTLDCFRMNGETTVQDFTITGFEHEPIGNTGHAFVFAPGMTVTSRSPYVKNITILTFGSSVRLGTATAEDPRGYAAGDAGHGAFLDGSIVNASSKEAAMLFYAVTFITPAAETLIATNGARVEWLNSFTYFAEKSMYLYSGSTGFAGAGKTEVRVIGQTGTFAVGNTLTYYSTYPTVLSSGTISKIDADGKIYLSGKVTGLETQAERGGKTITAVGNAQLSTTQKKFGTASLLLDGTGDYASIVTQSDFAFPSTISRLAKTITANGNAAVSAVQSKFGSSSIAFDGTGDYLSIATDTDYGFGTGDFTIEGWFYKTAVSTQYLFDTRTTLNENSVAVQSNGSGSLRLFVNGSFVLTSSNAHTNNAWNHLAISRASGVTRFFINGVVSTATYTDATNYGTTKPLVVGAQYNGTTAFAGYIDDFRVSNTARYTATFTPTTTAFVDDFNTKLLVNGNSTIVDNASYGTATNFTIEGWIYPTAAGTYHTIFDFRSTATEKAIYLGINTGNQIYLYVNGVYTITTAAISISAWTHVAVVRYNATTKIYVNGTQSGASWADITNYGTTKPLRIGADFNGNYGFTGYIDDVRISNDTARYTGTFTAPSAALTNDNDCVLLAHFDGANTSTVFLDDVLLPQDIRTNAGGTATAITLVDHSDFGAEIRSIGSASVYGNYGVYGDGLGVVAYLIGQNLAYIGVQYRTDNDVTYAVQANEVVELNGAKIYYSSVDHKGDFRVGELFYVNQAAGTVEFSTTSFNISSLTGVTFTDGVTTTYIDGTEVSTGNIKISGNTIESTSGAVNIISASDEINLQNNVNITGNLDVTGDVTVGGNITLGNQPTDTISIVAGITSNITPGVTETYTLGTNGLQWANLYTGNLHIDSINIDGNVIKTVDSNTDLELRANGTGRIYVPNDNVLIDNDLTVLGTSTLGDTNITGTVTYTGNIIQTGNVTQTGNYSVSGTLTVGSDAQFQNIKIAGNTIRTTLSNSSLELSAAGTGIITMPFNNVSMGQNLTVAGNISSTNALATNRVTAEEFYTGDILVKDNYVATTVSNSNLELRANGTGYIVLEEFNINANVISSNSSNDVVLQPGTGKVVSISSDQSLIIPVGNTGARPTAQSGMIRFNSQMGRYEGYDGTNWIKLSGVGDLDETTYITAELTPGANDDTIRFYNNNALTADLTSARLQVPRVEVDNIIIDGNTISSTTDTDIIFNATGSGSVKLANFAVKDNSITNTVSGAVTTITQTGTGYFKIAGTNGFVVPTGISSERPTAYAVVGMTRYNSELKQLEIYNGTGWDSAAGAGGGINSATAEDIAITYALILG